MHRSAEWRTPIAHLPLASTQRRWLVALALALAAPAFSAHRTKVGMPRVFEGDEPHYLVMVFSLLEDGDLDLANQYLASHRGGLQAGRFNARWPIDHHTAFWRDAQRTSWPEIFETASDRWLRDAGGRPIPTPRPGAAVESVAGLPEIPLHPAGLPLLLSALVWPLRGTAFVEPACVLIAVLSMIGAMLLFHAMALRLAPSPRAAFIATALAFLATPAWHYSRAIFNEGFLLLFALGATYLVMMRPALAWLAGFFVAAGMLMKPPFALLALPLAAELLRRRNWRAAASFALPCVGAAGVILGLNAALRGSLWQSDQPFQWGNPLRGALGLLLDPRHGLLPHAPLALFAAMGWKGLLRTHRREARVLLALVGVYFLLIATWGTWWGGWCYGPRLILPVIPLFMFGLLGLRPVLSRSRMLAGLAALAAASSLAINARHAFVYWRSYSDAPLWFASAATTGAKGEDFGHGSS